MPHKAQTRERGEWQVRRRRMATRRSRRRTRGGSRATGRRASRARSLLARARRRSGARAGVTWTRVSVPSRLFQRPSRVHRPRGRPRLCAAESRRPVHIRQCNERRRRRENEAEQEEEEERRRRKRRRSRVVVVVVVGGGGVEETRVQERWIGAAGESGVMHSQDDPTQPT